LGGEIKLFNGVDKSQGGFGDIPRYVEVVENGMTVGYQKAKVMPLFAGTMGGGCIYGIVP